MRLNDAPDFPFGPKRRFGGFVMVVRPKSGVKQTCRHRSNDAIDPKRHFARVAKGLFDHVIGNRAHRRWHLDAECSRSLKIDDELEFGRL